MFLFDTLWRQMPHTDHPGDDTTVDVLNSVLLQTSSSSVSLMHHHISQSDQFPIRKNFLTTTEDEKNASIMMHTSRVCTWMASACVFRSQKQKKHSFVVFRVERSLKSKAHLLSRIINSFTPFLGPTIPNHVRDTEATS
jgi:hypothetical protein